MEELRLEHRHIITGAGAYDLPTFTDIDCEAQIKVNNRIFSCCLQIWDVVKGVLCVDSPEGYEPGEFEGSDLDIGPKDTLSFCWRALKESRFVSIKLSASYIAKI